MKIPPRKAAIAIAASLAALGVGGCASWHNATTRDNPAASAEAHRGPVTTTADAAITAKVKTKFAADDLVKARRIDVDTMRGVVQLNGTVNSAAERSRAIDLARNTDGVVDVKDNLRVSG